MRPATTTRVGLAARLRQETRAAHAAAERSGIMRRLLRGTAVRRGAYCALLRGLHELYDELEASLVRHAAHPGVAPVPVRALRRAPAIAADLGALHGPDWAAELRVPAATAAYRARLREVAGSAEPERLTAHAYVRYLGDLSGGQLLRRHVAAALALDPAAAAAGTTFYDFSALGDLAAAKARFRAGLDAIPPEYADAIVDEARLAFALNIRLFEEVDT